MTIASIPENDRKERFIASAGQTSFPFDFPIYAQTDLQVLRERADVISTLTLGTDYTVTGAGDQAGGSITLTTGAAAGDILVLLSNMPTARNAKFVNGGDLPAASLESEFNRLRILFQQTNRDLQNTLLFPSTDSLMPALPPIASRAGRFLAFDALGQPYAAGAPGTALDAVARAGDTMTGPLRITPGSAAAPGLTPAGDADTGIFAPAADVLAIAIEGTEIARFSAFGIKTAAPQVSVASAATLNLYAENSTNLLITGTNAISALGIAPNGYEVKLRFAASLTLTHNANSLILPGGASITTRAGDTATAISQGSGNWLVAQYTRAAGGSGYMQIGAPQVVSGVSAVDFTLNANFRRFRLEISRGRVAAAGQGLGLRCGTGGVFDAVSTDYSYVYHLNTFNVLSAAQVQASFIELTGSLVANDTRSMVSVEIDPGTSTGEFLVLAQAGVREDTTPGFRFRSTFGIRLLAAQRDQIRIFGASGANISGTFTLFGAPS